jgi:copper resistance protein B
MNMKNTATKKLIATALAASLWLPAAFATAEDHSDEQMHDHGDNPVITKVMLDKLELQNADGANPTLVEAQAWIGKDLNKLWLKTDIEKRTDEIEDAELQALYSHAIAPFWDLQLGLRQDQKPTPSRTWGVLGVQGLAPYFFEVDAALFIGEAGRSAARFSAEYDLLFTQRLILSPELEVNLYGQNDAATGKGSGLSDIKGGIRLRYEICREFAPYLGVNWNRKFGASADYAQSTQQTVSDANLVIGLRLWF